VIRSSLPIEVALTTYPHNKLIIIGGQVFFLQDREEAQINLLAQAPDTPLESWQMNISGETASKLKIERVVVEGKMVAIPKKTKVA
jgi:hypothetical protein